MLYGGIVHMINAADLTARVGINALVEWRQGARTGWSAMQAAVLDQI